MSSTAGSPRGRRDRSPVFQITAVRRSLTEDVRERQRRYLLSMSVRTVCFFLAIVSTGWLRWAFLAGALLLPYIAVVIANGGREPNREQPATFMTPERPALESTASDRAAADRHSRDGDAA